jgi:predicted RNA-binding protein Jag
MNARDRRQVYEALRDDVDIEAESGEEVKPGAKRVVVRLKTGA